MKARQAEPNHEQFDIPVHKTVHVKSVCLAAFIVRCSGAATGAWALALSVGLAQPVWAAISALVVSQEQLRETRCSLRGRILGTLVGIAVTVLVSELASFLAAPLAAQLAVAIAMTALVAHKFPTLRVAMWTCPMILLTASPAVPIAMVALRRGSEVILGAAVAWVFDWAAERVLDGVSANRGTPNEQ
jgi:uncharacterized membrane protein YccC